jgi:hypothetical protein
MRQDITEAMVVERDPSRSRNAVMPAMRSE